jgi:hypothetical protein
MTDETEPHSPTADPPLGDNAPVGLRPASRGPLAGALARAQAGGLLGALRSPAHSRSSPRVLSSPGDAPAPPSPPLKSPTRPEAPSSRLGARLHASSAYSAPSGLLSAPSSSNPAGSGGVSGQVPADASGATAAHGPAGVPGLRQRPEERTPDLRAEHATRSDDILPSSPRQRFRLPTRWRL